MGKAAMIRMCWRRGNFGDGDDYDDDEGLVLMDHASKELRDHVVV